MDTSRLPSPRPFLTTERLVLRSFTGGDRDIERLLALDSDPEVTRFLTGGRPTSREALVTRVLPRLLHIHPCLGTPGYWAAEERGTGAFLGWFEFRPLEEGSPAVVELGYRLRCEAWGRGHATEGSRALIRKGFTELGVERVTADTMAVNTGSRRVMEKAGLSFVRAYRDDWPETIPGSEHGEVEYALTRQEWSERWEGAEGSEEAKPSQPTARAGRPRHS
ncbi:GNAT family N-acetyltransferase [Streptomyces sp. NPDC047097]|uniref:GNAT family N-acetyltransferase n=1 Tax=Streptomyces sp. NPDC047097 TaxID=3155260 RepID=UPI0033CF78E2